MPGHSWPTSPTTISSRLLVGLRRRPLEQFAAAIYRLLESRHAQLPPALQQAAPRMVAADWLVAACHLDTVDKVLQIFRQAACRNRLGNGLVEIKRNYPQLEADFRYFLHDACAILKPAPLIPHLNRQNT
ncbi:MAG: ACP phosphodiesterase [Syntrophotaleaceae bacterium]